MSGTGTYTLMTQDDSDPTSGLFTAYSLLRKRLQYNNNPTLDDVEKTHNMFVRSTYKPYVSLASEYFKISGSSRILGKTGAQLDFELPTFGLFTNDAVLHIRFNAVGNQTAYAANTEPTLATPLFRYCSYPGIRLLKNVELRTNGGVVIDRYGPEDVIAYKNFFVSRDHKPGWERCYGQDEVQNAVYNSRSFTGVLNYSNGYQTPKLYHDYFDMFIPLHFWFCEDVSSALVNYAGTVSQRRIHIDLESFDNIIQSLVYDNTGTGDTSTAVSGTSIVPLPINGLTFQASLYVNQLYTYDYISNIVRNDFKLNLIRVHKRQITGISTPSGMVDITNLKFPGEYLCVGFRNAANADDFDKWHLMGSNFIRPDTNNIRTMYVPAVVWNAEHSIRQLVTREAIQCTSLENILKDIEITSNGINIYPKLPYNFFNDYLPIRYNKNSAVVSPLDNNMILITFCFYPGKFNPSGYFNMSTLSNDFKINYWLGDNYQDTANNRFEIIICMSALNFLYKTNSDAISLKYTM
jgi:hypothetical protein